MHFQQYYFLGLILSTKIILLEKLLKLPLY